MPIHYRGRVHARSIPLARLDAVALAAAFDGERDLRRAPMPISGGLRHALAKETAAQDLWRGMARAMRPCFGTDTGRADGMVAFSCRCGHATLFDGPFDPTGSYRCDRCGRKENGGR